MTVLPLVAVAMCVETQVGSPAIVPIGRAANSPGSAMPLPISRNAVSFSTVAPPEENFCTPVRTCRATTLIRNFAFSTGR